MPLFIFEPRYKLMLKGALATHRMFGIGVRLEAESDKILPVTTIGLISACKDRPDGTSHLMLLGLKRARIVGCAQEEPFYIAKIEPLLTTHLDDPALPSLRDEAIAAIPPCPQGAEVSLEKVKEQMLTKSDLESLCDILTYHFVRCGTAMAASLCEPSLVERYRILITALGQQNAAACKP